MVLLLCKASTYKINNMNQADKQYNRISYIHKKLELLRKEILAETKIIERVSVENLYV